MDPSEPPERRLRERVFDLVERHGDDYLEEGKRLLRRASVTLLVVAALFAYAILR